MIGGIPQPAKFAAKTLRRYKPNSTTLNNTKEVSIVSAAALGLMMENAKE